MDGSPLVLCLTNTVAANFTANVLLAIGAKPAMVEDPSEAAELAAIAQATLVNLGTVTRAQAETMRAAIAALRKAGKPWVLDPVAVHLLTFRRKLAEEFLACRPSLIRGNHAEISFLRDKFAGFLGSVPNGGGTITLLSTGAEDVIWSSEGTHGRTGGVPMLQTVTATGCAQGAVAAAFLGWGQTPERAAESASRLMKSAGERAFARAQTPGGFQMALLDALYELAEDFR